MERLFHGARAPLGDFASRTDIAYALGLINAGEEVIANVIRGIRNQFAHTLAQIDFSHELIERELSKLSAARIEFDVTTKEFFTSISLELYIRLRERKSFLVKQRAGLGGAQSVPVYKAHELSKVKSS